MHDHKGLVNLSMEGINELLHEMGGIEEYPSKNGVFSKTQECRFERARESKEICTKQKGVDSHKELREPPQIRSPWTHKRKSKIHHKEGARRTELNTIESPEGTRREGPPFPINSRTKSQESISKISP